MQIEASGRRSGFVPIRDGASQRTEAFDRLPAARHAPWRLDVEDRAADDRLVAAGPPQDESIARGDGHRLGQPQDREGRAIGKVDRVATGPPDHGVDGRRAEVETRASPVRQHDPEPDEQPGARDDRRVGGQDDAAVQPGSLDPPG